MSKSIDLSTLNDNDILKLRFCDLNIQINGTWLEQCIADLYNELESKGINFRPIFYLADEWLVPENEPVVGIAFYLAHQRLMDLEKNKMNNVEGGDKDSCMRLLRHETGHAINYAYQFYRRKRWKQLFGRFSKEYPDRYKFRPYSKGFVINLEDWYAQYHPDEDFAETFAVWLDPKSDWKNKYKGWKALQKLEYIDDLIKDVSKKEPIRTKGKKLWDVKKLKTTLKTHYKRKTEFYAEYAPDFHDQHLNRIFPKTVSGEKEKAYKIISKHKKELVNNIDYWTLEKKYIINQLIKSLIKRCKELNLETNINEPNQILKLAVYMTSAIMNYIYTGRYLRKK